LRGGVRNGHILGVALYLFVSPHLDDVALSAGGLVRTQVDAGHDVVIASLCTQDPPSSERRSALAAQFHEKWGEGEAPYEERRSEDRAACSTLGARALHLDLPDAIYRGDAALGQYASFESLFADIPSWDASFSVRVAAALQRLIAELRPGAIFGPLAAGRNVDHQHVLRGLWLQRAQLAAPLALYEDQPYAAGLYPRRAQDAVGAAVRVCPFVLRSELHAVDFEAKRDSILCYESQIEELFGPDRSGLDALDAYGRSLARDGRHHERLWIAT